MPMILALALALQAQPAPPVVPPAAAPADPVPDDIVVVARRHKCNVEMAERTLSAGEFDARMKIWALGKPVRVYAPADSDYKCLAKIMFRLADRGVKLVQFVDTPPVADAAKAVSPPKR